MAPRTVVLGDFTCLQLRLFDTAAEKVGSDHVVLDEGEAGQNVTRIETDRLLELISRAARQRGLTKYVRTQCELSIRAPEGVMGVGILRRLRNRLLEQRHRYARIVAIKRGLALLDQRRLRHQRGGGEQNSSKNRASHVSRYCRILAFSSALRKLAPNELAASCRTSSVVRPRARWMARKFSTT